MRVSEDGLRVVVVSVTYDRSSSLPVRFVAAVDTRAGRVRWQRVLPAVSCCALPVFDATPEGGWVAVGGAAAVDLFRFDGTRLDPLPLDSNARLNTALRIGADGRRLWTGQAGGRVLSFHLPGGRLSWSVQTGADLADLAASRDGHAVGVVARDTLFVLSASTGGRLAQVALGPTRVAVLTGVGDGFAVVWKALDGGVRVGLIANGRWRWKRVVGKMTVPQLEADASGRWLAVTDFLGEGAWLVSADGAIEAQAAEAPSTAALAADGRFALASHDRVEVRSEGARRLLWKGKLPGRAYRLRLGGRTLAVLGAEDANAGLPDRLWLFRVR